MSLIDILLSLLIVSSVFLIFVIINSLKKITESVVKTASSISNMEKKIDELSSEISETVKNLNVISEEGVSLTKRISDTLTTLETITSRIKNLFPSKKNNPDNIIVEDIEARANDFVKTIKAFSAGFKTFFSTVKKK